MIQYFVDLINGKICYRRTISKDGVVLGERTVCCPLHECVIDNVLYLLIFDDDGKAIHPAFKFLNVHLTGSDKSRRMAANAIRLLYCWLGLTDYDPHNLVQSQISELIAFMQGADTQNGTTERPVRSNSTVNQYMSYCRSYLSFIGVDRKELIFQSKTVTQTAIAPNGYQASETHEKYETSLPEYHNKEVPKFISKYQFFLLLKVALAHDDMQAVMLMSIMYLYGLRLGECLGLTNEDMVERRQDDKRIPKLIIRNRASDADFQYAKNKMHVTDKAFYKTRDYQNSKDEVTIGEKFYRKLKSFCQESFAYYMEKYPENFEKGMADCVSRSKKVEANHYLFMNRYGKVLNDQVWNTTLRKYFIEAGIPIDNDGKRSHGLSHRFRHGCAMRLVHESDKPITQVELQKRMRHRSIASTFVYYNPTPEMELQIKEEELEDLLEQFPELEVIYGSS